MRRRRSRNRFLWLAVAVAMCPAGPVLAQDRPKETVRPAARPAQPGATIPTESARPANGTAVNPPATQGGTTTRSPQTGAAGANESARPADGTAVNPPAKPSARSKQAGARAEPDVVTLNFVNADIEGVVKVVSEITGKNFIIDPRVKGTVTIVSARPLPRAFVYDVFLSALRLQGFAAVEDRGIVKIVPEADAKLHSGPTIGPDDKTGPAGDRIETRVFTLEYESAAQVLPILRPLIAPNNTITAYQNSNTLVITDYASNVQRLAKIIESIDQPSGTDPISIPLQYASAVDVAATINRLFAESAQAQGAQDPTQRFAVIADVRSNSLLARSGDSSRLARLRKFVAMLDSPTSAGGNIHVVYLKNAEAVKLAETLRAIYQSDTGAGGAPRPVSAPSPLGASMPASMGATATTGAATPPAQSVTSQTAGLAQAGAASAPGIIQADASTNSIIIIAPDAIYNNLRAALDKLDVRRAQVYVEALIAELTADKAAEFGVQWQSLSGLGKSDTQAFGGTNFGNRGQNIIGLSQNPATAAGGLNVGVVRGTVTIPGVGEILNIGLLVRALETDANANILSTPTLLTLDNEEAAIVIGQNVPFITGSYAVTGAATTPTPFQTIERRDVGLTLRIKPQISEGGTVRLQIYQEVSSVVDTILPDPAGVTTNKRAVASTVLVDDGQIVVIGGLIQDTVNDGYQKVPVLGDLPILGGLFRYKTRSHNKTNLMIFLRPTIVRDSVVADTYTGERYDYILGEQEKAQPAHDPILPDMKAPTLPPKPVPSNRRPSLDIEVRPYPVEGQGRK